MTDGPALGRPVNRVEGRAKVTGSARYAADVPVPGLVHAVLVQSTIAHGEVTAESLQRGADRAGRHPGVLAVLTPLDCPRLHPLPRDLTFDFPVERRPPLADLTVQHAGQHLAVVVADTLENATHAATVLDVQYRPLPAHLSAAQVLAAPPIDDDDGPIRHGWYRPDHFVKLDEEKLQDRRGPEAEPTAGIRVAAQFRTAPNAHYPIEQASTIAAWDDDLLTIHDSTRWITGERQVLAGYLGIPPDRIRILAPLVGGAFGSKSFLWMHVALCAVAARVVGRPVKLVLSRAQMFTATGHRPPTDQQLALLADADGIIASTEQHTVTETSTVGHFCEPVGLSARFLYHSPRLVTSHTVARTHTPTPCFMRGPGEAPGLFALEVAMDELAAATGVDPVQLRIANDPTVDQASGRPWSGKHLVPCYRQGAQRFGWQDRSGAPRSMRRDGLQIGWGMATATYPGRRMAAECDVHTDAGGQVCFSSATHEIGTGVRTIMTQIAADAAGLPLDAVSFRSGDSAFAPAPYSGASQTTATVGSAVHRAATEWKRRLLAALARADGAPGAVALDIRGGDLVDGAGMRRRRVTDVLHDGGPELLAELTFTAASSGPDDGTSQSQSFGAHFCEVQVDEQLGRATVTRWVAVLDCGRVLNPKLAHSQVMGGILFGLGMALLEQVPRDPHTGQLLGEYYVPTHADPPLFDISFVDAPDYRLDPLGARGVGELGGCGVPAAIANAIHHATGRRHRELPITVEMLMKPFEEDRPCS